MSQRIEQPLRPVPPSGDEPHHVFRRGKSYPRAIAWFGFRSFWGHLWHLAASVVATEDIDARDWMTVDDPEELVDRIARVLGAQGEGASICERLGSELWIDFIADTGDDSDVSGAVADMLFRDYRVPDGDIEIVAPRGHVLLFGGDTAYPVATDDEIHNRVCVPFNRVLRERRDGKRRVLLGIPGNHDWYDGLDGFARMFRVRRGHDEPTVPSSADERVDRGGQIGHFIEWVEAFSVGRNVAKRGILPLIGYSPVQNASYFALPLAPGLDLWGVDRQLRTVDYSQRSFFRRQRSEAPERGLVVVQADPLYAMLEPFPTGQATFNALELDIARDAPLVLSGDTHHYCRQRFDGGMHVVAGGGGAFLHPAGLHRAGKQPPEAEFPGPKASLALAMQVPWQLAAGRAGFMVHIAVAATYLPFLLSGLAGQPTLVACAVAAAVAFTVAALLGGWRKRKRRLAIGLFAGLTAAWIGVVPLVASAAVSRLGPDLGTWWQTVIAYAASIYPATLGFGTYLFVLTVFGLDLHQGFSALAHPGYKHFVRLRIRRDGSGVDGWVIGKVDPLDPKSETLLVDRFSWESRAKR